MFVCTCKTSSHTQLPHETPPRNAKRGNNEVSTEWHGMNSQQPHINITHTNTQASTSDAKITSWEFGTVSDVSTGLPLSPSFYLLFFSFFPFASTLLVCDDGRNVKMMMIKSLNNVFPVFRFSSVSRLQLENKSASRKVFASSCCAPHSSEKSAHTSIAIFY